MHCNRARVHTCCNQNGLSNLRNNEQHHLHIVGLGTFLQPPQLSFADHSCMQAVENSQHCCTHGNTLEVQMLLDQLTANIFIRHFAMPVVLAGCSVVCLTNSSSSFPLSEVTSQSGTCKGRVIIIGRGCKEGYSAPLHKMHLNVMLGGKVE